MADVFISHSTANLDIANWVKDHLEREGISVFLAPLSLQPGQHWSTEILQALNNSSWVIFLASRAACDSQFVQQELGGALITGKKIIPVVWDMSPSDLPGWTRNFQALNLAGKTPAQTEADVSSIASRIKANKATGLLIVGLLIAGLMALGKAG